MSEIDWSKYDSRHPRVTGFRRHHATWKVGGKIRYMMYARWMWRHHHGAIPNGHIIHHIDKNPMNDDIENLLCIPRSEHERYHSKPPPTVARVYGTEPKDYIGKSPEWLLLPK